MTTIKPQLHPLTKAIASALPAIIIATASVPVQANYLQIQNHWVRDFLDFGQNKGAFKPGAMGIKLQGKDGTVLDLPNVPMPDFSAAEIHGAVSSLGGAYGFTVAHNRLNQGSMVRPQYGHSVYNKVEHYQTPRQDVAYLRYNKFVVETTGYDEGADFSLTMEQAKERYATAIDSTGQEAVIIYRVGNGKVKLKTDKEDTGFLGAYDRDFQTGGIYKKIKDWKNGYMGDFFATNSFTNKVTPGDSGSLNLVYDKIKKKWVIFGATAFLESNYYAATVFNGNEFQKLKDKWTQKVDLKGGTLTFDETANSYQINGQEKVTYRGDTLSNDKRNDKDLVFSGGGTIKIDRDVNLGNGGLIFDEMQTYNVTASGTDDNGVYSLSGAGLNVGAGTVVNWKGVSGISCPGRLLQVGNLARLPIFFMGFRLDLAFVGAEVEGPTRSVGGSSSDPTNAARAGLAHMRRRAACERPKIALL